MSSDNMVYTIHDYNRDREAPEFFEFRGPNDSTVSVRRKDSPVEDTDYSMNYIVVLLRDKLVRYRDEILSHHTVDDAYEDYGLKLVDQCIDDADILMEYFDLTDVYSVENNYNTVKGELAQFHKKYGNAVIWTDATQIVKSTWSKCTNLETAKNAASEYANLLRMQENNIRTINTRFFDTIRDNYMNWWD